MALASTVTRQALRLTVSAARPSRPTSCFFSTSPFASSAPAASSSASSSKLAAKKEGTLTELPQAPQLTSSCAAGTVLHGLSILKDQPDPVAKPDEEYPEWLWTIIPTAKKSELATQPKQIPKKGHEFDFVQEKKRLRAINKSKIKASNFLKAQ